MTDNTTTSDTARTESEEEHLVLGNDFELLPPERSKFLMEDDKECLTDRLFIQNFSGEDFDHDYHRSIEFYFITLLIFGFERYRRVVMPACCIPKMYFLAMPCYITKNAQQEMLIEFKDQDDLQRFCSMGLRNMIRQYRDDSHALRTIRRALNG